MSLLFISGGQSIEVSTSASVLPMNIQGWFPLEWIGWISLQSKGLSRVFSNTSLSHSIVFLYFSALFTLKGFLTSHCYSLEFCIQMGISFLFSFACHFFPFFNICRASSDNHFAFLHFFFLGMVLIPASCTMLQTTIHNFSGTLSDLIPWIYLSLSLYNHKGIDLGHTWMV